MAYLKIMFFVHICFALKRIFFNLYLFIFFFCVCFFFKYIRLKLENTIIQPATTFILQTLLTKQPLITSPTLKLKKNPELKS